MSDDDYGFTYSDEEDEDEDEADIENAYYNAKGAREE
jgi:COP9 signalosome complex subunit 2